MTIMIDAGYLNGAEEIRGGAAEMFFKHRDEIIQEKIQANTPESSQYDFLPRESYIRDKEEFPTFHRNWIDGILTSCLKILNHVAAISSQYASPVLVQPPTPGPICDPLFVYQYISNVAPDIGVTQPQLDINKIITYFALPGAGGEAVIANDLGLLYPPPVPDPVEGPRSTKYVAAMQTISSIAKYEKRNAANYIPLVPSDEFPNLNYGDSELSIKSKQELLFTAVVNAFDDLVKLVLLTPAVYLFPISTGVNPAPEKPPVGQQLPGVGLVPIFNAAKKVLNARLPDPESSADNAITNVVNFEALKRWLVKPLYLAVIGVLFGSHEGGFTGLMGSVMPDAVDEFNKNFTDPKPEKLNIEEKAEQEYASAAILVDPDDSTRNNIPLKRQDYIPRKYKNLGKGFKNEFYQKLKEIGSKFVSSGPVNSNADDNHKGLIFLLIFNHETSVDPGASNSGKNKQTGKWESADGPGGSKSDAMIWGASVGNLGGNFSSFSGNEFRYAPVWDPNGSPDERGMDVMQQLEFYQEFLARNLAFIGSKLQNPKTSKEEVSGGKIHPVHGVPYAGPDPHVQEHLKNSLNKYLLQGVTSGQAGSKSGYIPTSIGGSAQYRSEAYKEYKRPYYYVQNPYDVYAFHMGILSKGDSLVYSPQDDDAEKKHVIIYTMAARQCTLIQNNEHIPRYMAANGMSSIDWDQVGIVGLKKYVDDRGNWIYDQKYLPKPTLWRNENSDELNRMSKLINERGSNNK